MLIPKSAWVNHSIHLPRIDKYETNVVLYWLEEEVEGEWSKATSTTKTEEREYEVEDAPENAHSFASGSMSLDPTAARGPEINHVHGKTYMMNSWLYCLC